MDTASFKIEITKVQDFGNVELSHMYMHCVGILESESGHAPITPQEREAIKRQIEDEYRQKIYKAVSLA